MEWGKDPEPDWRIRRKSWPPDATMPGVSGRKGGLQGEGEEECPCKAAVIRRPFLCAYRNACIAQPPCLTIEIITLDLYYTELIISPMWDVEYTDEFEAWWDGLNEAEQQSVYRSVERVRVIGPALGRPHVDLVKDSRFANMKELRTQVGGRPLRTFFAFDPRRCAILLIGGDKTGDDRFYERMIPEADRLYAEHLESLEREGK